MTESDRFWLLVSRKLANEASRKDIHELQDFLKKNPDYQAKYEGICTFWKQDIQKRHIDVDTPLKRTLHILDTEFPKSNSPDKNTRFFSLAWFKVAAVVALLVLSGFVLYFFQFEARTDSEKAFIHKRNEKGMRSEILLSDGSSIWLNADSELKYPETLGAKTREVYLSGEAYFDIAKDSTRPFIIHLEHTQIKVLGTSFNVKAYKEEEVVETTVVSGKVAFIRTGSLTSNNQKDTLLLTPNYKGQYSKNTGAITKTEADPYQDTAWKDGKLVFKSARLLAVGKVLERTFGKKVTFSNHEIKKCRLTATFQENSLEEIMILIAKTNDYAYEITEEKLTISGEGCH